MINSDFEENTRLRQYRVESVEKIAPPDGMPEGNWFRYIISEGRSIIEGFRPGSLNSVTQHAETFASDLNSRAANGYSFYVSRKKN